MSSSFEAIPFEVRKFSTSRGSPKTATPSPSVMSWISVLTLSLSVAAEPHEGLTAES